MQENYLLPASFKKWGWSIFVSSAILGIFPLFYNWEPAFLELDVPAIFIDDLIENKAIIGMTNNNILNEICAVLVIIGGLMVAFSKEKYEDEFIASIRLKSLVWATYLNYGILLLALILVYDFSFMWVLIFNMFTILLFFIILFHWNLVKLKKSVDYAE
jgi:hypothetical protein